MVIRIRKAKKSDALRIGIHLLSPTKTDLERAKERAYSQGFKTIWIHRKLKRVI